MESGWLFEPSLDFLNMRIDLDTEDNELEELEERAEARKKTTEKQV